jgi:hypothetical protein
MIKGKYMLQLATAVYHDIPTLCASPSLITDHQLVWAKDISRERWGVDAFIAEIDTEDQGTDLAVVVRGTESWTDVMQDLQVCKSGKADTSCLTRVHCGFLAQAYALIDTADDAVRTAVATQDAAREDDGGAVRLWLTGHSLGGAVASLLAYMMSELKDGMHCGAATVLVHVETFGSPRVGNYWFREAYRKLGNVSTTRHFTPRDIITRLPCINYWHVGDAHRLPQCVDVSCVQYPCFRAHKLLEYAAAFDAEIAAEQYSGKKITEVI